MPLPQRQRAESGSLRPVAPESNTKTASSIYILTFKAIFSLKKFAFFQDFFPTLITTFIYDGYIANYFYCNSTCTAGLGAPSPLNGERAIGGELPGSGP